MRLSNQGLEILDNQGIKVLTDYKGRYFTEPKHALVAHTIAEVIEPFTKEFLYLIDELDSSIVECQDEGTYDEQKVELLITEIKNKICEIEKIASVNGNLKSIESILDFIYDSLLEIQDECRELTCIEKDIENMFGDISEISSASADNYGKNQIVIY